MLFPGEFCFHAGVSSTAFAVALKGVECSREAHPGLVDVVAIDIIRGRIVLTFVIGRRTGDGLAVATGKRELLGDFVPFGSDDQGFLKSAFLGQLRNQDVEEFEKVLLQRRQFLIALLL